MSMLPMAYVRLSTLVGGGNREPMVVEVKQEKQTFVNPNAKRLGNIYGYCNPGFDGDTYDTNYPSKTIAASPGGKPYIIEVKPQASVRHFPFVTEREADGKFMSSKEWFITKLGTEVSNAIVSRYYKGIEGSHSMAVLEVRDGDS